MGEPVWTTLEIGGRMTPTICSQLEDLLHTYGGFEENDDLAFAVASGRPLCFSGQQNYGEVDQAILDFLTANNLPWKTHWEGVGGVCEAGLKAWKPGMPEPIESRADTDGDPIVTLAWLRQMADEGHSIHAAIWVASEADITIPPITLGEAEDPAP